MSVRYQSLPNRRELLTLAILSLLIITIFSPILGALVGGGDFGGHEIIVRNMEAAGAITLPHFLYHVILIGMDKLFPSFGLSRDSLILMVLFELMLGAIFYGLFNRELGVPERTRQSAGRILFILALMTIAPILPHDIITGRLHPSDWGYLAITTYFNPTMILVRPLALLLFYFSLTAFLGSRPNNQIVLISAVLVILSTLAKPNYSICLLPAVCFVALVLIIRKKLIHWNQLLFGLVLPLIAVLAWQFWFAYSHKTASLKESHIIFAPFGFFHADYTGLRYILSILFPLVMVLAFWKKSRKDFALSFAWLIFLIGSFYSYFLAESGDRFNDGNFVWCGEITLFILFVVSTLTLIKWSRQSAGESGWKFVLLWAIFVLHAASGVVWYVGYLQRALFKS